MQAFIGTKLLLAQPMTRGDWCAFRGWDVPADENPADHGFMVEYTDGGKANVPGHEGYVSWSPKDVFEAAYQPLDAMSFGHAIVMAKAGKRITRAGWNGKGMFIYLVPAASYPAQRGAAKRWLGEDAMVPYRAYLAMKTVDDEVVPWLASQTDMLADDWTVIAEDR